MHRHSNPHRGRADFTETKLHILKAGRELLLAAQGALAFCKHYVEASGKERRNPHLIQFFSKAIDVAEELGRDLKEGTPLVKVAQGVAGPIIEIVEKEMKAGKKKARPATRRTKARSTKRATRKTRRSKV